MTHKLLTIIAAVLTVGGLAIAGCGASSKRSGTAGGATGSAAPQAAADAKSAATGDIPDNQQFLTFRDSASGYSIQYPEGWTQGGSGADVTFRDKDNTMHLVITRGPAPAGADVLAATKRLQAADPTLKPGTPTTVSLKRGTAVKLTYTRRGPANPVTGKRPFLIVDRYVYAKGGRVATLDLATPKGVDNVDAYRLISRSFRWR